MRVRLSLVVVVLAAACTNPPTPGDASAPLDTGLRADAFTPSDANADAPRLCSPDCTGTQLCCPDGLAFACMNPTPAGVCPMPDLTVDGPRAGRTARVVWQYFAANDCAVAEMCVTQPGWRRLLRFDTFTPNVGTGDLHLGNPATSSGLFVYSMCHMHYHFNGYAQYALRDSAGAMVAEGHKQAFCLEDFEVNTSTAPARYTCADQGISMGWADTYGAYLDCNWIDVTDVAPGNYTIHIDINRMHTLPESRYDNNTADAPVTIAADSPTTDPTAACNPQLGGPRDCGWMNAGTFSCMPGASIAVGCGGTCGVGSCVGDAILRICPGTTPCGSHTSLGYDDSSCGGTAPNDCPGVRFSCPTTGMYTVLTAPYTSGASGVTCVPAAGATLP